MRLLMSLLRRSSPSLSHAVCLPFSFLPRKLSSFPFVFPILKQVLLAYFFSPLPLLSLSSPMRLLRFTSRHVPPSSSIRLLPVHSFLLLDCSQAHRHLVFPIYCLMMSLTITFSLLSHALFPPLNLPLSSFSCYPLLLHSPLFHHLVTCPQMPTSSSKSRQTSNFPGSAVTQRIKRTERWAPLQDLMLHLYSSLAITRRY